MISTLAPLPVGVVRPAIPERTGSRAGRARSWLALLAIVVLSRLATTIGYVEDTDSLRFALSVADYDVAALRPHFPGYPVFVFVAKILTAITGSYAIAFSLIGAVAVWGIIVFLQRIVGVGPEEPLGVLIAGLVFFNPLIWLLSNRFMPDLLGAACALAAFYHLLRGQRNWGFLLAGLLAGIRLSYLPFLLPPVLVALARGRALRGIGWGTLGVGVWLLPLVLDTGWGALVRSAGRQTEGHFADFGGTVLTEPRIGERLLGTLEALLAHGLGMYWPGRHPLTLLVAVGMAMALAAGIRPLRRALPRPILGAFAASWATYAVWIFFGQNVLFKSRHVLPLLPPLLLVAAFGVQWLLRRGLAGRGVAGLFLAGYAAVALVLVQQHRSPTAIAQVAEHLRAEPGAEWTVVSHPLVNFYLATVGVRARFVSVEDVAEVARVGRPRGRVVVIGVDLPTAERPTAENVFYHNPYVNRMWPEIVVREYGGGGGVSRW